MGKIALITGATSGIGHETSKILAENGFDLIITGRRKDLLIKVKNEIESSFKNKILALHFDVSDQKQVKDAIAGLPEAWQAIDILVNNAGLASGLENIDKGDVEDWEKMIDTNIKGLLYMTREVSPLMVTRKKGHIVNISSIAGREVYENGNVYCATKHAVEALSKGMRLDLLKHNIKVTAIAPGMVETEFSIVRFHGDTAKAKNVYTGFEPLTARDIAETILFVVTRPAHVCINDLLIMPTAQANATNVKKDL